MYVVYTALNANDHSFSICLLIVKNHLDEPCKSSMVCAFYCRNLFELDFTYIRQYGDTSKAFLLQFDEFSLLISSHTLASRS